MKKSGNSRQKEDIMSSTVRNYFIGEFGKCSGQIISDKERVAGDMERILQNYDSAKVKIIFHPNVLDGYVGTALANQFHLSMHAWPDYKYVAINILTFNLDVKVKDIINHLGEIFNAEYIFFEEIPFGANYTSVNHIRRINTEE